MRAVERFALAGIVVLALLLRLWGAGHGLPYVFSADENAHFVPRAIGMFGHSLNPQYFVNPPAFTYLLHAALWARWGTREAVGAAFAADPGTAFMLARVLVALLGAAAAGLLAWAGVRLAGPRVGLVAGALFAVAFLPVHYAHFAVNDVPALAPLCLSLAGAAGVYREGRLRDYALAGAALGVACATKYTAGIVLLCLLGAAAGAPNRARGLALAGALALAGFALANPYALFDLDAFRTGLSTQSAASGDGGGKLGLVGDSGVLYYLGTTTWGLGWIPALAAAGGAVWLARAAPGSPSCSCPRRCCSSSSWACRTASSRAGCCPSIRCCAFWRRGRRSSWPGVCAGASSRPARRCARRAWSSRSTTTRCSRAPTRGRSPGPGWSTTSPRARAS